MGKVPSRNPDRTVGGVGSGALGVVCDEPAMRHMFELTLEFNREGEQSADVLPSAPSMRCRVGNGAHGTERLRQVYRGGEGRATRRQQYGEP